MRLLFYKSNNIKPVPHMIKNHGHIHDSNEDLLRTIKLYNQVHVRNTSSDNEPIIKHPRLLKYRASNLYVFITAASSIFASINANYTMSPIISYLIAHQIKKEDKYAQKISDEFVPFILSAFHLIGLLIGLMTFAWLGGMIKQRKISVVAGTLTSLLASGVFIISTEYWVLFLAKSLQGVSNACIWLMCSSLIADIWSVDKLGSMVGLISGLFPLGMTFGLTVGAIFNYVDHKCSFFCQVSLSVLSFILQLFLIEKSTIPSDWLKPESKIEYQTGVKEHEFKDIQQRVLDIMEEGGVWSKSSSMSTINLKDQPVIFEKEEESNYNHGNIRRGRGSIVYHLFTSLHLLTLLYQVIALSVIIGALEPALASYLISKLNIVDGTLRDVVTSTFLFPCALTAFGSGWLCDRFGSKIVSSTTIIIAIPTFIWIGVPNQNIQSVVSALAIGGTTITAAYVSIMLVTARLVQRIVNSERDVMDTENNHLASTPCIFAILGSASGVGYFAGLFLAELNNLIGFFWLCFIFSMLLANCIPFMVHYSRSKRDKKDTGFSQSTSKKSIINNTRPESFAESTLSDDEDDDTTVGTSSIKYVSCEIMERKSSVIVMP